MDLSERLKRLNSYLKMNPDVSLENILYDMGNEVAQLQSSLTEAREAAHWADDMRKNYKQQLNDALEELEGRG